MANKIQINQDTPEYKAGYKNALHDVCKMIKQNGGVTLEELKTIRNNIKL